MIGLLFVASSLFAFQRCSTGGDAAAKYVAANCNDVITDAIAENRELSETDINAALDECLADWEASPEFQASYQAFLHMTLAIFASIIFGGALIALVILGILRDRRKIH